MQYWEDNQSWPVSESLGNGYKFLKLESLMDGSTIHCSDFRACYFSL